MNATLHQVADGIIHQAMTLHRGEPGKARRDDGYREMTAFPGTGMAGVPRAVVADVEPQGVESGEACAQVIQRGGGGAAFMPAALF